MNELLRQAKTGMNVTNIMLGKRNQMQDLYNFIFEFYIKFNTNDISTDKIYVNI